MARIKKSATQKKESPFNNYWTKKNYQILGAGIVLLILGFFLMTRGPWDNPLSLTFSPIVLVIAYFVVIPFSIFYTGKKKKKGTA